MLIAIAQGDTYRLRASHYDTMRMAKLQCRIDTQRGEYRQLSHYKSVALPRPQKARCGTPYRRSLIVASAAVTEIAEKLYQNLESAALELKRTPPSLVGFPSAGIAGLVNCSVAVPGPSRATKSTLTLNRFKH